MTEAQVRVLIVDDQALLRGSLRVLIETEPDLVVVGEAGTGAEAIDLVRAEYPDVVLMDVRMPGMDGIEATRRITAHEHAPRILVLTTFDPGGRPARLPASPTGSARCSPSSHAGCVTARSNTICT